MLILTSLISFSCCKSAKNKKVDNNLPLLETQWNLVAINGKEISNEFAIRPFIVFDSTGAIHGSLGCNSFFGNYTLLRKQKLTLEYSGATKRLCTRMDVEKQFMSALKSEITNYEIAGENLLLFSGKEEVLKFTGVDLTTVE